MAPVGVVLDISGTVDGLEVREATLVGAVEGSRSLVDDCSVANRCSRYGGRWHRVRLEVVVLLNVLRAVGTRRAVSEALSPRADGACLVTCEEYRGILLMCQCVVELCGARMRSAGEHGGRGAHEYQWGRRGE